MNNLNDKQIFQINNIIDTLIEASEHFSGLMKEKEIYQSIYIFNSIVEGMTAINKLLNSRADSLLEIEKINNLLLLTTIELEKNNFSKVLELNQFSLVPQLRKLKDSFEEINTTIKSKEITIGVYYDQINPRKVYPETRINALVEEAEKQGVKLLFFSSSEVSFEDETIKGEMFLNDSWQIIVNSFPDVIHNIGITQRAKQSIVERKLRRKRPFTSFGIGNKFYLPKKIVENVKFAELLVPFKVVTEISIIYNFLDSNNKAVIKPIAGRRGLNIYHIYKSGAYYFIQDDTKEQRFTKGELKGWIQENILKTKNGFMIQRYIEARTIKGEPFDIRAHVQKNREGKWQITKIYPRIGNRKSILSNISRGGRTEDLKDFLINELNHKGEQYEKELINLSLDLTQHIDKLYGLVLDELGLDLAIDRSGRIWLHEVNMGPQSTYHENDRAVNTIGYARYIAENGIYLTNSSQKEKGHFKAKNTKLPLVNTQGKTTIGMLVLEKGVKDLEVACAYVAEYEGIEFFYFTPKDIDYDEMLIRGHFYKNKKWMPKLVNYPDAVYDRLRLKGRKGYNIVYEELEGIPFTNEFFGNSISKLEVYNKLASTKSINEVIIPYQKITKVRDINRFIEKYGKIIVKPEVGSFAKGVHFIEKVDFDKYFLVDGEKESYFSEVALFEYLRVLIKKGVFIVQKYIETRTKEGNPFDIRVHMMKDGNGKWSFPNIYPRIGVNYATISPTGSGGYIGGIDGFLKRHFNENTKLEDRIKEVALKIAASFENLYIEKIGELGIDIAIDKSSNIYLIEVNVNQPGILYYEFEVAKHAIPYAIYLAEIDKIENTVREELNEPEIYLK
ncbi:YheC/YheD family protein [Oceanobacillus sp. 1P07AA]|uniref:YheC/YheD family protein n=1 Tax=Oceanobacillus sp. 1P07AA TaxID=3132293 RepID=UPI0039A4D53B